MTSVGRGNSAQPASAEREFVFTPDDFRVIAAVLHGDAGIYLPETKATLVYSRLAKRLRLLGLSSFNDYCALIQDEAGVDERQAMLAALTTNVTRFFREPHHFDHLRERVLPDLVARARAGGRVRLWSSACSSGQEPYSMALTLLAGALPALAEEGPEEYVDYEKGYVQMTYPDLDDAVSDWLPMLDVGTEYKMPKVAMAISP